MDTVSMSEPSESDKFRAEMTRIYSRVGRWLIAMVIVAAGVGWLLFRWWGLGLFGIIAAGVAFAVWVAVSLIWAMSQDGN